MTDRGKTFSPAMVLALIAGTKRQTRRIATKSALAGAGQAGDRIYVREHWKTIAKFDKLSPVQIGEMYTKAVSRCPIVYLANAKERDYDISLEERREVPAWCPGRHRQAMHMPRWATRLTLLVDEVRVEPLQRISSEDAIAEGIHQVKGTGGRFPRLWQPTAEAQGLAFEYPIPAYMTLWNSLHPEPATAWHGNPEVIVTSFTVVHENIDAIRRRAA